jgi:hypothetical protein
MITKEDEQMVEHLKKALEIVQKWGYIDILDRLVNNLKKAPNSYKYAPEGTNFYTVDCPKCGWWGSSELLDGGGQIADTGDYGDSYCPVCGSNELDEKEKP